MSLSNFGVDSVAIVSGGMDSVTMLYKMVDRGRRPLVLSFNYGQRHKKELEFVHYHTAFLGLPAEVVDLDITHLIGNSALTSGMMVGAPFDGSEMPRGTMRPNIEVPEGHYAEESMKATVVPNRNMMMLAIAGAVVVNNKAIELGIGVHAGDHFIYPDCRNEFIRLFETTFRVGNEGFLASGFQLYAPFLAQGKHDIVTAGTELDVNYSMTWSCYKGGARHCGKCGTCVERKEAFQLAHVVDPTEYEENNA